MKVLFTSAFLLAISVLTLIPVKIFAQNGTLVIYASNTSTIDQIINGDVTGGVNNHSVYQLASIDTTYMLDATITSHSSISIVGMKDPVSGRVPCIEADVLPGGQIPALFFKFTGLGTRVTLKNLYLLGTAPNNNNNVNFGQGVQISADGISLTVDNCIFDFISQFEIGFSSNWNNFYIMNSRFRNGIDNALSYYVPELLRSENAYGNWNTDTVIIKYNTLLALSMGAVVTSGIVNYYDFSHNDVLLTFKSPFFSQCLVNARINNNIFYNTYSGGENRTEYYGGWDDFDPPRIPAIFSLVGLDSARAATFLGHPINGTADSLEAEAARNVEIKNNAYYWSPELISFWTAWNDTATVDTIYTPVFMNDETSAMFNDPSVWPGFVLSGNQSSDPEFGPSIDMVLNPGSDTAYGVGLLNYIAAVRSGTGASEFYAYQKTTVGNYPWTPVWPLPETEDLQYSNIAMQTGGTDGLPLGDPTWFGYTIPVELTSFTASVKQEIISLNWTTATEINNRGFEVERLSADSLWQKIGFVPGNGTTTLPSSYYFTDNNPAAENCSYRLKQIDFDGTFNYSKTVEVDIRNPQQFSLKQNFPNPFNPSTKIRYSIPNTSFITLKIYDILGKEIAILVNEEKTVGTYELNWDAADLPSGVYFYQIRATSINGQSGDYTESKKTLLLK